MSPESVCKSRNCAKHFFGEDFFFLRVEELGHHERSFDKNLPRGGAHRCSKFKLIDEDGKEIGEHVFQAGRFHSETIGLTTRILVKGHWKAI